MLFALFPLPKRKRSRNYEDLNKLLQESHLAGLVATHAVLRLELRVVLLEVLLNVLLLLFGQQRGGPWPPVELREPFLHHPVREK